MRRSSEIATTAENSPGAPAKQPLWQRLVSRRAVIPWAVFAFVVGGLVAAQPQGWGAGTFVIAVLCGVVVLVAVANLGFMLAGFDRGADALAERLATDPDQRRLLARWLNRARWARTVGGLTGVVVWLLATNGHGDLLVLGTGGIAAGAMIAELHHVRRRRGPRVARLDVRRVRDYLQDREAEQMSAVVVAGLVELGAGLAANDVRAAIWFGIAAVGVIGLTRLVQHRVASRPRPARSDALTRADDLARELAIGRGLARPATYFGLALVARGCFELVPAIGNAAELLGVIAWITALLMWWRNRRLGLDHLLDQPSTSATS